MRKIIITTVITGLIGIGGVAAPMAAFAADPSPSPSTAADTTATLGVTGGPLTISAGTSARLDTVDAGQTSASGQLGDVTVDDQRAVYEEGWTASATSTDLANTTVLAAAAIPASALTYVPGDPTGSTGSATFQPGDGGTLDSSVAAYSTSDEIGAASVSWDPTINIVVPANAVAGIYSGTVTHSVA